MNTLKKFFESFLALWVAFGSICMVTGIEAAFAVADNAHAHHHAEIPHDEVHGHTHHETPDDGHNENENCCEDGHGFEAVIGQITAQVSAPAVVSTSTYDLYFKETDALLGSLTLEQIRFSVWANDPPDLQERQEAERDATKLIL